MIKFLGIVSLVTFLTSLIAHLATFLPFIMITMDMVWYLHFPGMLLVPTSAIMMARQHKQLSKIPSSEFFAKYGVPSTQQTQEFYSKLKYLIPPALFTLCKILVGYISVNIVLFYWLSEGGTPEIEEGKYLLLNHGYLIREITEAEYHRQEAYMVRFVSSFWMLMAIWATVYYLIVHPQLRKLINDGEKTKPS